MNCKQAHQLIHELLDGDDVDRAALDGHLAECPACRREFQALEQVEAAVTDTVQCNVPDEALERATAGVLAAIRVHDTKPARVSRPARAAAMAAVMLVVFGLGLGVGRWAWPRQVTVTQIVKVPEVREKIVKVEVPVVKERIVVKRVPVYKTRIVYRDREVEKLAWGLTNYRAYGEREPLPGPVKCDEIVVCLPSIPIAATAHVSEEVQPAEVLDAGESVETSPTQGHWQPPHSTTTESGTEMVIAQNLSD